MRGAGAVCPPRRAWRSARPPARAGSRAGTIRAARVSGGGSGAGAAARGRCALRQGAHRRAPITVSLISISRSACSRFAAGGNGRGRAVHAMRGAQDRAAGAAGWRRGGVAASAASAVCWSPGSSVRARRAVSVRGGMREVRGGGAGACGGNCGGHAQCAGRGGGGMATRRYARRRGVAARRLGGLVCDSTQQLARAGEGPEARCGGAAERGHMRPEVDVCGQGDADETRRAGPRSGRRAAARRRGAGVVSHPEVAVRAQREGDWRRRPCEKR